MPGDQLTIVPIDVVALTQAVFTGITALLSAFAAVYAIIASNRAGRAERHSVGNSASLNLVQRNVELIERNTNSLTTQLQAAAKREGDAIGMARGIQQGVDRATDLADARREALAAPAETPVAVTDERATVAAERVADATEKLAEKKS